MSEELHLRLRAEPVPWFGLFFSWITMLLGISDSRLRRTTIELVPGDLPSVEAVSAGEADFGLTTPPVCATMGFRGVGPFSTKMESLRALLSFPHDDRLVWAVPAEWGVRTIDELQDRRLRFAVPGKASPVRFAVEKILEGYGISLDEMAAGQWELLEEEYLFKVVTMAAQGKADMVVHEGRKTPPWVRLTQKRPMTFLPVREDILDTLEKEYGFRRAILSKGMIGGAVKVDTPTVDWSEWLLFTREDVDGELVREITRIVVEFSHLFEMAFKGQPLETSDLVYPMDPREIWKNVGIPLHEAAEAYFREAGHKKD